MPEVCLRYCIVKGTVGTTPTAFPHDMAGGPPRLVLLSANGSVAGVLRCTARSTTTVTIVSSLASTTFEALCVS